MIAKEFVESGAIWLPEFELTIMPSSSSKELRKSIPKGRVVDVKRVDDQLSFEVKTRLFESDVYIYLFFKSGKLLTVCISPLIGLPQSTWPEEKEKLQEEAEECSRWFSDNLGIELPASFSWGEVRVVVHQQSWETPIVIDYK